MQGNLYYMCTHTHTNSNLSCLTNSMWWFLWHDLMQLIQIASLSVFSHVRHLKRGKVKGHVPTTTLFYILVVMTP